MSVEERLKEIESRLARLEVARPPVIEASSSGSGAHPVPSPDLCFLLEKHPNCKPEWAKFLSQLRGYTRPISEKQWKFFCVIHKECLGTWPPSEGAAPPPAKVDPALAAETLAADMPF